MNLKTERQIYFVRKSGDLPPKNGYVPLVAHFLGRKILSCHLWTRNSFQMPGNGVLCMVFYNYTAPFHKISIKVQNTKGKPAYLMIMNHRF